MTRILVLAALALAVLAGSLALAGRSSPCSGHGGVSYQLGGWWYCHDGTREYGWSDSKARGRVVNRPRPATLRADRSH
jgi:hypothetical protein